MMLALKDKLQQISVDSLILAVMILFAVWLKSIETDSFRQYYGFVNFSLGFVLLASYITARSMKTFGLPKISGYLAAGIVAGPYVSGFLTESMTADLRLIDDLALSFIALTAGGELSIAALNRRRSPIILNLLLQTVIVFGCVFAFVIVFGNRFDFIKALSSSQTLVIAILLGVISIARSPSSAIALINECKASGPFTETILGVTVAMDVMIIILFTIALSVSQALLSGGGFLENQAFTAVFFELILSFSIGGLLGKGISIFITRVGRDLPLFLIFTAFFVTKAAHGLAHFTEVRFDFHLQLEPLLICMSAGFVVRNMSGAGKVFLENLNQMSLPIYILFFSLAGASLNMDALILCWPLALFLTGVRMAALFISSRLAGAIVKDPPCHGNNAWMAYLTQAGVAIGLAQLVSRKAPETGEYLSTIVLAVIALNQIIGPVTFKAAMKNVGESKEV